MFDTVNRVMLSGLGLMSVTRERAEQIFDELVQRGQMEKSQRGRFVEDLTGSARQAREEFQDILSKQVRDSLERLNVPTREDIVRLENKLDELLAQCREDQNQKGAQ